MEISIKDAISAIRAKVKTFYHSENMILMDRNLSFAEDVKFMNLYKSMAEDSKERGRLWRLHVFNWCFAHALKLSGDIVELGVYRGFSSAISVRYHDFIDKKKKLYLFDTWDGIPEDQLDAGRKQIDKYKDPDNLIKVKERFLGFDDVLIVQGRVPEVFATVRMPEEISFLHVDLNTSKAEIAALEVLFDKVVSGGIILLDDFGLLIAREQMIHETEWFGKRGYMVCELPTSQALVIKV